MVFTDGSKEEGCYGMVGGGWFESESGRGAMTVGRKATVWDGEIAGLEGALSMIGNTPVLLVTDSGVAIQTVQKAGKKGIDRTRGLAEVVRRLAGKDKEHFFFFFSHDSAYGFHPKAEDCVNPTLTGKERQTTKTTNYYPVTLEDSRPLASNHLAGLSNSYLLTGHYCPTNHIHLPPIGTIPEK